MHGSSSVGMSPHKTHQKCHMQSTRKHCILGGVGGHWHTLCTVPFPRPIFSDSTINTKANLTIFCTFVSQQTDQDIITEYFLQAGEHANCKLEKNWTLFWRLGCEADHTPPACAKVKEMWIYTPTPPYTFMDTFTCYWLIYCQVLTGMQEILSAWILTVFTCRVYIYTCLCLLYDFKNWQTISFHLFYSTHICPSLKFDSVWFQHVF
jgi:hypothetical protein